MIVRSLELRLAFVTAICESSECCIVIYDKISDQPIISVQKNRWKGKWSSDVEKIEMDLFWCISMKGSKLSDSVFSQWDVRSSLLKILKTKQSKTPVSHFFQILWPIQDGTMSKSMPRAFRKCVTCGDGDDLSHSYRPSKSSQISKIAEKDVTKKDTASIFFLTLFLHWQNCSKSQKVAADLYNSTLLI